MTGIGVGESAEAMFPKPPSFGRKFEKHRLKKKKSHHKDSPGF